MGDHLRRVNHLDEEPDTQVYSARAFPPWVGGMSTSRDALDRIRGFSVFGWCECWLAEGLV